MDKNESVSPTSCLILSKIVAKRGWAHPFGGQRHGARADFLNQTPIMGDSDDAAGIFRKQFADDGTGKRGEIARRFIQKQDIRAALCHHQEHQLGFLPAGKPRAGMVHLVGGEFHAAQKDTGSASLFLFAGRGEQLDGGQGEIQQVAGILRHIEDAQIGAFFKRIADEMQEGGFAYAVMSADAQLFSCADGQADIPAERPPADAQLGAF